MYCKKAFETDKYGKKEYQKYDIRPKIIKECSIRPTRVATTNHLGLVHFKN